MKINRIQYKFDRKLSEIVGNDRKMRSNHRNQYKFNQYQSKTIEFNTNPIQNHQKSIQINRVQYKMITNQWKSNKLNQNQSKSINESNQRKSTYKWNSNEPIKSIKSVVVGYRNAYGRHHGERRIYAWDGIDVGRCGAGRRHCRDLPRGISTWSVSSATAESRVWKDLEREWSERISSENRVRVEWEWEIELRTELEPVWIE